MVKVRLPNGEGYVLGENAKAFSYYKPLICIGEEETYKVSNTVIMSFLLILLAAEG